MARDMMPGHRDAQQGTPGPRELFELTTFLAGRSFAWGVFEDRFGRVRRRFSVELFGSWHGTTFHLEEKFAYEDGTSEARNWRLSLAGSGKFVATCDDCVGTAVGSCDRDTIHMVYRFRMRMNARELHVDFDDRIHRIDDLVAVNRATVRKWGVKLGEVSLFFLREEAGVPEEGPMAA